jgi:hypothetical protein
LFRHVQPGIDVAAQIDAVNSTSIRSTTSNTASASSAVAADTV